MPGGGVKNVRCVFFFFQAEDGIRDLTVTGVQTCALPIYVLRGLLRRALLLREHPRVEERAEEGREEHHLREDEPHHRHTEAAVDLQVEIGRASCRERV